MNGDLRLTCLAGTARLDVLAPLYRQLHEHHARVAPAFGGVLPARAPDDAWERRRRSYVAWLARPSGFVLLAHHDADDAVVGYIIGSVEDGYAEWSSDGDVLGVVHDVVVAAVARGIGIGSALLDGAEAQFRELGIGAYRLNVAAENRDALRLYERRGMTTVTRVLLGHIPSADA